ncbi:VOC family protein [Nocardioides yefusunii]|uniref:VOC family protein n=1 Tax=Nocardioides yefusunii TaxID=2500546 RepID=A0ABW1QU68_9ACTN|nr:VOC family protein [Nocardioides yefusunii]
MSRHHRIDYVELAAPDLEASKRFYGDVFGWTFVDYGPGYAGIACPDSSGEIGGLDAAGTPGVGSPLVIIYSDDLDATHAEVSAAGGKPAEPYTFPGGRRFHFSDPAGNELAVWATH